MAVKIRLARRGRKKLAIYDVVVANSTAPRDGRFIEKIGVYNPASNPAHIELDDQKAFDWIMKGAQPTDTVKAMLSYRGILLKKHLQIGVSKGAITQDQADKRFQEWQESKEAKITGKKDTLAQKKESDAKARMEAEAKVKEARAEALRKKNVVEEPEAEKTEEVAEKAPEAEVEAPEVESQAPEAEAKNPEASTKEKETKEETEATEAEAKEETKAPESGDKLPEEETKEEKAPKAEEAAPKAEETPKDDPSKAPEAGDKLPEEDDKK